MEQAIWISIGVISLIISLGILVNLVNQSKEDLKIQKSQISIEILKGQCNLVCDSPLGTSLAVDVDLPSEILIFAGTSQDKKICGLYKDKYECSFCDCPILPYTLNLSSAKKIFASHKYKCFFGRVENAVTMECQG